jgi:ribosomal protein S18 acetylase RimI-like enzyme
MNHAVVTLHRVTPESAHLLDAVDDDVFDHAVEPERAAAFLADRSHALVVACVAGRVVGMASAVVCAHLDKPSSLYIDEVGVSGRFQRQGIGRRLMECILAWGRERGCHEAWVATLPTNHPARGLFRAAGGIEDPDHAVICGFPLAESAPDAPGR